MKKCAKCGGCKEFSEFPFRKDKNRYTARCKSCVHMRQAVWLRAKRSREERILPDDINEVVLMQRESVLARIASKVVRDGITGCNEWPSAKARRGYPMLFIKAGNCWFQIGAHRLIAAIFHGLDLRDGETLACHKCDNRSCCERDHIFTGSHADNTHDAQAKGRLRGNRTPGPRPRRTI